MECGCVDKNEYWAKHSMKRKMLLDVFAQNNEQIRIQVFPVTVDVTIFARLKPAEVSKRRSLPI